MTNEEHTLWQRINERFDQIEGRLDQFDGKLDQWDELFHGRTSDDAGIVGKVHVLWSLKSWILCSLSAALASGATLVLTLIVQYMTGIELP